MTLTEADEECVQQIAHNIRECKNLFGTATFKVTNLVTGKEIDEETASFLLSCIRKREECYKEFRTTRLFNKTRNFLIQFRKFSDKEYSSSKQKAGR